MLSAVLQWALLAATVWLLYRFGPWLRQQLGSRGKESARYPERVRREILEGRIGGGGLSPEVEAFNERVRQDGGGGKGGFSPAVEAFSERQRELRRQAQSRNDEKINLATELYLLWIDNGDGDMPVHPKVRAHYTELARMRPACPVDVEAMTWLKLELKAMSDDAIRQMVRTAAARMAGGPAWDQAHRDNIDDFIRFKNGAA